MSAVKTLNPNAETMGANAALFMNINAAKGLHDVMKTNLGPKGTIKMLVGGAGGTVLSVIILADTARLNTAGDLPMPCCRTSSSDISAAQISS